MTFYRWSKNAETDATIDPTINWAEGQAPSTVNNSGRAMMAAAAKYRDDISGALATSGTGAAYSVTSNQGFDTLANMDGKVIAFSPHVANLDSPTLTVDGLGTFPIKNSPALATPAGTLLLGTPYVVLFDNSDNAFYLVGLTNSPFLVPLGSTLDFWLPTAPNSSFVFPYGQAISRTTYAALYGLMGTVYGVGDGVTTFNIPDLRGRVVASPDNMGGGTDPNRLAAGALASVRNTVGGNGGESAHGLVASEIPAITSNVTVVSNDNNIATGQGTTTLTSGGSGALFQAFANGTLNVGQRTSSGTAGSTNTGGQPHNNIQPTILGNRIMRIL